VIGLCADIMSDQVVIQRRHLRPLYYPSGDAPDFVRYTSPAGNPSMNARDKFDLVRAEHTWHAGPMSQKLLVTQIRWAELKMWLLYYRIRDTKRAEWPGLLRLVDRLACSWYFQSDCMEMDAIRLARRVRNDFVLQRPRSKEELRRLAQVLLRP